MRKTVPFLLILLSLPLAAQTPYLVKDINPFSATSPGSSTPYGFIRFGPRVYFAARDNHFEGVSPGTELWATGTAAGTTPIKDVNAGLDSSNPSRFVVVNGKLLFNAQTSSFVPGGDLWATDGSNTGTTLIANFEGRASWTPGERIAYHDKMLFTAGDDPHGRELWITDGTLGGTRLLKDVVPGVEGSDPRAFVVFNDFVYFGTAGGGFWKSDGTEAGTVSVNPSIVVSEAVVAGSRMFLAANSFQTGIEPWVSDGTAAGTHVIAETAPGVEGSISGLTVFGDRILFTAVDAEHGAELWITDGTAAGTHIVRDINPGPAGGVNASSSIAVAGNVAYFSATTASEGQEIWKTDGTEGGTAIVRDILPGSEGSAPAGMVAMGTQVFFVASNGTDRTLWVTDGTNAGTKQVKTTQRLAVGTSSLGGPVLTAIDGVLYFAGANSQNGYEPWKSDGSDAGTSMLLNIAIDSEPSSDPRNLTAIGNSLFFSAWDGTGPVTNDGFALVRSLWRTDGTSGGTIKLTDSPSSVKYTPAGNSLFFSKNNGMWMSDGTPEGTIAATAFAKRFPVNFNFFINFVSGDKIFALVSNSFNAPLTWATTTAPDAPAVSLGIRGDSFSDVAGRVLFFSGTGLWTSDATLAGTYAVVPDLGQPVNIGQAVMGGRLYFIKQTADGSSLWRSDGTFEGTTEVKPFTTTIGTLTAAGRNLFFIAGTQLWVTDGTPSGTHALPATPIGSMAAAGDRVIFAASEFITGQEPWVSDGTAAGTHLLLDVRTGEPNSGPTELTSIAGLVYFAAFDALHGNEPWVTDGTAAGTRLVADVETAASAGNFLNPGSSSPKQFVRAGERVYFAAATLATGNELWAVPLPSTPRLSINDLRVAEGDTGTRAAHFTVTMSPPSAQTVTVDYATSDDSATSGSDYDSASGTLTFAAGETSKSFDVTVRGDVESENNEVFFITLRNPAGATLEKTSGFAVIDDDDQIADLSLALDFSQTTSFFGVVTNATNNGPRTATNMRVFKTSTPGDFLPSGCCSPTTTIASALVPGATVPRVDTYSARTQQVYRTASITARQRDPQPSNNRLGWTTNPNVTMDALFLNPDSQANVWFYNVGGLAGVQVGVESSNPAVLTVPSKVIMPASNVVSFVARGVSSGVSTIRIFTTMETVATLRVDVVPAGTTPRWPGAISEIPAQWASSFDKPATFAISPMGTAPYTGEQATGIVTLTSGGREVGRVTLAAKTTEAPTLIYYPESVGVNPVVITYAGDANFLPITMNINIDVSLGSVTMLAGAARTGTTASIHVRVAGSPSAAPTGTIILSEGGKPIGAPASLASTSSGIAEADIKLSNVAAGPHTFTLAYSGDTHYAAGSQSVRMVEAHERAVRH